MLLILWESKMAKAPRLRERSMQCCAVCFLLLASLLLDGCQQPARDQVTPTSAQPLETASPALCIFSFSALSSEAKPGDSITLTWQAIGDEAFILHDEEWGALSTDAIPVPLSGTTTVTVNASLRRTRITYVLMVRSRQGGDSVSTGVTVWLACPEQWFFSYPPDGCPQPVLRTTIVVQQFERGMMIYSSADKRIYALEGPLGESYTYSVQEDTWREGMAESDPSIIPPQGFYQPVRGLGLTWRTQVDTWGRSLRERLGWATGEAFVAGEGFAQEWVHGKQLDIYITGPNNTIILLPSMGSAKIVPTPPPGALSPIGGSPTREPGANVAAPSCATPTAVASS